MHTDPLSDVLDLADIKGTCELAAEGSLRAITTGAGAGVLSS
jgi:hypothetical protein